MKKLIGLFILISLLAVLSISAFAESAEYFYVNSQFGNDKAAGTDVNSAVKTFTQATRLAANSKADTAYIVITNKYVISSNAREADHEVPFVITTKDDSVDYSEKGAMLAFGKNLRYILSGDTTFENIAIEYSGTLNCVAQYNHITFGDNLTTKRTDSAASGLYVVGGWQSPVGDVATDRDTHITIKNGSFLYVIGGTRQRVTGEPVLTLTGTHYIDIEGGEIENLLGASAQSHYSQDLVVKMSGGKVNNFNAGGDETRRLNGIAMLYLAGGEINNLNVNNVIGDATVKLLGTKVGKISVIYANSEVQDLKNKARSQCNLLYDARYYNVSELEGIAGFDKIESSTVVYTAAGAKGDGMSETSPASFTDAIKYAAENKATVTVLGKLTLSNFTEPEHAEPVKVVGADGASIEISGTYTLAGETSFNKIKINGNFNAKNGMLSVLASAEASINISGSAYLEAGNVGTITDAKKVILKGAKVESIVGSDETSVEVNSGSVGTVKTTDTTAKNFALAVSGGSIDKVVFANVTDSLTYTLMGGEVKAYEVVGNNVGGKLLLNEKIFTSDSLGSAKALFSESGEKVFFVATGGTGSGMSAATPMYSLEEAYASLSENGGTIVISGEYTITEAFNSRKHGGKITITSVYGGVDYQKTNAAKLIFQNNFYCGGETEFNNITIKSNGNYRSIYAAGYKLVLGDNITSIADVATNTYMSVMGGSQSRLINKTTDLTINSGIWQRVRGGTAADGTTDSNVNLTINGGTFIEYVTLGSSASHSGNINVTVNGGEIRQGMYASTLTGATQYFKCNTTLTINGGTFYGIIAFAQSDIGTYSGSYTVNVNGGDFEHVTEFIGAEGYANVTSAINVTEEIDINAEFTGTTSFTNPIRSNGADPWLFYLDGYYYYTATGANTVGLCKAPNIGDLKYAEYKTIVDPEDGHEWSKNLWSPEIHYYTDEEIGEGNGGWYLFIACDDGDNVNHRMYVLKCLDGDNLFGRWGDPVTGEVNVPRRVVAKDIPNFDNIWAAGMSEIRIGGKLYMLYITETGRLTADFHQTINIVEMTNPWTIVGESKVICYPEYEWEKGGYSYNPSNNAGSPAVVEGSTAIYAKDGSIYIIYSGSGYWTVHYNLSQLKYLGGDPLEITSWKKSPEPILYKSDSINGCGHASYVTDVDGQGWVCYHAYIGKDTSSGRSAFVEPYFADKNGVVIADGSGHPASIDKVYTVNLNPLPLAKRIGGFDSVSNSSSVFAKARTYDGRFTDVKDGDWYASYVKNAYELKLANGTSDTKFSPDSTFTVAQALTAASNIHTAYYQKSVRAAVAGEAWYVPYVEYCVQNGIITEGQFKDFNVNITRGDMAIVFANILPDSEYAATRDGSNPDVTSDMACYGAVAKLYKAGIVGGDAGSGNYRPGDSIKRSEACVIFTRIAMKDARAK